jgi:hypothetical protein
MTLRMKGNILLLYIFYGECSDYGCQLGPISKFLVKIGDQNWGTQFLVLGNHNWESVKPRSQLLVDFGVYLVQ